MKDKHILKLCLFCSVVGLIILFISVQQIKAERVSVSEVTEDKIGYLASVQGRVTWRYFSGEHLFFKLDDGTGEIKVVVFENNLKKLKLDPNKIQKGIDLMVEGVVDKYKGELEILPERIYFG